MLVFQGVFVVDEVDARAAVGLCACHVHSDVALDLGDGVGAKDEFLPGFRSGELSSIALMATHRLRVLRQF